jgi:hypothetical protein
MKPSWEFAKMGWLLPVDQHVVQEHLNSFEQASNLSQSSSGNFKRVLKRWK